MTNSVAVIVPTYKEAKNIPVLTERIAAVLKSANIPYEIDIVDDNSQDGTEETAKELSQKYPVKIKVRRTEKGLSSAVIAGFELSNSDIIVVMDADLSHPPEKIPELIQPLVNNTADFVIGSRFVDGGGIANFNAYRKLNAWVSKTLARPLTNIKDPMAGFFAFPRALLKTSAELNPLGFKIALELIVKAAPKKVLEIPIQFQERLYGESKLSLKEQVNYVRHLAKLIKFKYLKFLK